MFLSKRNGIYCLWYTDEAGRKRKVSTRCKRKSEALEFLQSFKAGEQAPKSLRMLLSEFTAELLSFVQANLAAKTLPIYQRVLKHLLALAGDIALTSLNAQHFDKYKTARLKTVSPITVNIELRALKAALNTAVRWRIVDKNPFERLQNARVPEEAPAYFAKADFLKLFSTIKESWLRDIVLFAALTGMRRGEIVNLRWCDVDLTRRMVVRLNDKQACKHSILRFPNGVICLIDSLGSQTRTRTCEESSVQSLLAVNQKNC